jgi:hypothetical protein
MGDAYFVLSTLRDTINETVQRRGSLVHTELTVPAYDNAEPTKIYLITERAYVGEMETTIANLAAGKRRDLDGWAQFNRSKKDGSTDKKAIVGWMNVDVDPAMYFFTDKQMFDGFVARIQSKAYTPKGVPPKPDEKLANG